MHVEASGTAKIKIDATGEVISISASDIDWECQGGGERPMGPELVYSADYGIEGHVVTWSVREYPVGVENHQKTDVPSGLTLIEDIRYGLIHDPE
jgi:hypothetical protein